MGTIKETVISSFVNSFRIGETVTKGQIFQKAAKIIPDLSEATVGWLISNWLINKGRIVEVGKGKHGAKIYRRAN